MKYPLVLKLVKVIWAASVIIASAFYLISQWERVENYFRSMPILSLIFATVFLILGKLTLVFITKFSVEREGVYLSYIDAFRIVTLTQLAKYIPGGIWHFVGRFNAYARQSITFKKSTRALISENLWLVSGAFLTGCLTGILSLQGRQLLEVTGIKLPVLFLGPIILLFWVATLAGYERLFRAENTVRYIQIAGAQLISWLCLGISFAFVLPGLSQETIFFDISVYSFGWLIGYIAIFAPGGIGVRETALVWMLVGVINSENAIIYSTVHRFLFVVVEIMLGAIASLISTSKNHIFDYVAK